MCTIALHHHVKFGAFGPTRFDVLSSDVGGSPRAIADHFALEIAPELRNIFVIRIQNRCAPGRQGGNQLVLGARDRRQGVKIFEVNRGYHSYHTNLGLSDFRQGRNFPGMRHSHFNDRYVVLRLQFQKHQWQAEVIVEIAFGLQHAVASSEQVGNRLFRRGLPSRSGNPNQRLAPNAAYGPRQRLQCNQGIVYREQTDLHGKPCNLILAHDSGNGSALQGLLDKIVAIETLALYREKQLTGLDRARVNRVAVRNLFQFTFTGCTQKLLDFGKRQLHAFWPAPAFAA